MKITQTHILSGSAIVLILISVIAFQVLNGTHDIKEDKIIKKDKTPFANIVSNYKGGEVTLQEAQIELNKIALNNDKLKGITFEQLTAEQKESIIKEVVLKEIAYKEAKKRRLHKSQSYKDSLKIFNTQILSQSLFAQIAKDAKTDQKVKKHYDTLAKDLEGQKDVQIRYISVKTQKEADRIYAIVSKTPRYFANQAKRKSLDKASAKNGGDLGFILRSQLQPEVANLTKKLQKGEVSAPILLNDKWVIIKLEDERDTKISKFEDVKEALAANLAQKALQDFISKKLEQAEISIKVK